MGEKLTQTMALEVWTLTTPADMFECLADLVDQGYRGNVSVYVLEAGDRHWRLEVNSDGKPSVEGVIGQTVVLFGGLLEAMTAEVYAERFGS
jgi:hypothetical protein